MADKKVAEQYYTPPPKLGNWEGFKLFLWNGETSQFMGRTAGSWGKSIIRFLQIFPVFIFSFCHKENPKQKKDILIARPKFCFLLTLIWIV